MSTTSSALSSSSPPTTSSAAASTMSSPSIHLAVTVKLTKANYLLWRAQLLPYLRSASLLGYVDGSVVAPPTHVASSTDAGADLVPNPAYATCYKTDQHLLSGLFSTMTEEILRDVVDAKTSKEAWDTLQKQFSSTTRARVVQLRVELATAKKKDLSAADFFRKIKTLASEMAAAGAALRDDEVITYLLAGLSQEYDPFVTSMTFKDSITLDEVYSHLVVFEARLLQHQAETRLNIGSMANYAGRGCNTPCF